MNVKYYKALIAIDIDKQNRYDDDEPMDADIEHELCSEAIGDQLMCTMEDEGVEVLDSRPALDVEVKHWIAPDTVSFDNDVVVLPRKLFETIQRALNEVPNTDLGDFNAFKDTYMLASALTGVAKEQLLP